jgi:hypothetical protein
MIIERPDLWADFLRHGIAFHSDASRMCNLNHLRISNVQI